MSWLRQRFVNRAALPAFSGLVDICPRPGYKVSGEERAWSRRLAKRFGADGRVDDRSFIVRGDSSPCPVFDYEPETMMRSTTTLPP